MDKITPKQAETIKGLEEYFGIRFTGVSKWDAQKWISIYLPRYTQSYAQFVAFYLFKNNLDASSIRYDKDGRLILPPVTNHSRGMSINLKNMVEYCEGLESEGSRVMNRIERFNNSMPTLHDIDNHLGYLTNVFRLMT